MVQIDSLVFLIGCLTSIAIINTILFIAVVGYCYRKINKYETYIMPQPTSQNELHRMVTEYNQSDEKIKLAPTATPHEIITAYKRLQYTKNRARRIKLVNSTADMMTTVLATVTGTTPRPRQADIVLTIDENPFIASFLDIASSSFERIVS
jgi:hypothetical protein